MIIQPTQYNFKRIYIKNTEQVIFVFELCFEYNINILIRDLIQFTGFNLIFNNKYYYHNIDY